MEGNMDEEQKKFVDEYNELCKKYGLQVSATPVFIRRDDGTWSLVLQYTVEKLGG